MLFNSVQFAVFLPIVFAAYWLLPHRYRWPLLLAASYYFYMSWNAKYVVLILFTTAVSYSAARLIERWRGDAGRKRAAVVVSLLLCLGVLFVFKYLGFFLDTVAALASLVSIRLSPVTVSLMLPVGISFYTFQSISYVIDVYRGTVPAERNLGVYATFVSFFPQLVAGPIERTSALLPQIRGEHAFSYGQAMSGARLIVWGLFKKMVVSDNLASFVDKIYGNPTDFTGFSLFLATILFALQGYCDFSGYSDIARGVARLFGIELMENFKAPYFCTTIQEYWSRWQISLSTWFRDYIYFPLGGSRCSRARHYLNILVTFLISGLWHGASWNFVIWGTTHGALQVLEKVLGIKRYPMPGRGRDGSSRRGGAYIVSWAVWTIRVMVIFVMLSIATAFIRAQSLSDATYVITHMFDGIGSGLHYIATGFVDLGMDESGLGKTVALYMAIYLLPITVYDFLSCWHGREYSEVIAERPRWVRWGFYIMIGFLTVLLSPKGTPAEFVYFQF